MIAVDLRGFGKSDRPTEPGSYAVEVLARDLVISSMHFLGTSMGGFIGQALAFAEPALCRSLILCHTATRMSIPEDVLQERVQALQKMSMEEYGRVVAT